MLLYKCNISNNGNIGQTLEKYQTEEDILDGLSNREDTRQLAVVSIVFDIDEDEDNEAFDAIFADDVDVQYADTSDIVSDLDLNDLIPPDIKSAGYFAYEGALTSPPCSDIGMCSSCNVMYEYTVYCTHFA